jgi:carboxypeptidase T
MKNKIFSISFITLLVSLIFYSFNFSGKAGLEKSPAETYSEVKVNIGSARDIETLIKNGITIDHYIKTSGNEIKIVINQEELSRLKSSGLGYNVTIPNLDEYYKNRPEPTEAKLIPSREIMQKDGVNGLTYGSMGGFYTYAEVVQKLDSMRLLYPNLITAKINIGTSHENRTIWAVKISDNPEVNESATEPAIYFDALHHAREPEGMASLMYFMYWLLENYNSNPEAAYIVNNREIFFVPVVNVDGYVYNQTTNPNGGGNWRKNRRNNGSCYGVDLNRNYPYGWGYSSGSSGDPCSDTYRGPSAGSEPETQAVRNFILPKNPKIALSVHSVAGRYLNPYGYTDTSIAYEIYSEFCSDFSSENNYPYGTVKEMLNYYSSGTTRDWLHSIGCYAWTPEVGGSGFWPQIPEIIPVASENLAGFKYLAWVGGNYARFQNYTLLGKAYAERNDTLVLQIGIKNKGLSKTSRNVTVDVTSPYPNLVPLVSSVSYDSILSRQVKYNTGNPFKFRLTNSAGYMDEITLIVSVKQESVETMKDTIFITVGRANIMFSDNAESGTSHWTKSGNQIQWDTSFCDSWSLSHSFADSRYGNSKDNTANYFTLNDIINLTGAVNPRIEFFTKWAIELGYDYARFQISTNSGASWINMNGRFTSVVGGQPSYHGNQSWVYEQINLNPYIGQNIKVRFYYYTDGGIPGDGYYFDNFRVVNYTDGPVGITHNGSEIPEIYALYQNYPNPFNPATKIKFDLPVSSVVKIKVFDVLGREVTSLVNQNLQPGSYEVEFNALNYPTGVYFYRIVANGFSDVKKMALIK